jgi:hypothetical protein
MTPDLQLKPPSRLPRALIAVAVVAAVVFATISGPSANASVPGTPPGWSLAFADDFTGPAGTLPSTTNWRFSIGHGYPGGPPNWGTGEIAFHTDNPANVRVDGGGNLLITPLRDGAGNWTSARIETNRQDFKPPPGGVMRIEGRLRVPAVTGTAALGYWPAFWALGSPYRGTFDWPAVGEFDIMENVNGVNNVWGVLHCGVAPGGPCNEFLGIGGSRACPGSPCPGNFHTYRFEWDASLTPNELRWYVDGQLYHSVSQGQLPADTWNQMASHAGFFIILNVAIGGGFPDGVAGFPTPTGATVPGHPMLVDYVAVWYRDGDGDPPPTDPPPGGDRDAYALIQAESFDAESGVVVENGTHLGFLRTGDWARFDGVEFGSTPPVDFLARVASGAPAGVSGLVEVRLDSPTNPPIGSFAIANTGGWTAWREVPGNVSGVTGTRTVFLTFTSGQPADFVNVDWFRFRR